MTRGRPRLLFVDDEPDVLRGIRTSLRRERSRWDLEFADTASAALDAMAVSHIDVLITDMRMPGMDGAALLRTVHARHPEVVRIVLSGEASAEQAMRSLPHVHRWLPKPCDRDLLVSTIESALGNHRFDNVDALVGGVTSLPSPPALYGRLLAELDDPDASFDSVSELVGADPAITAKILQWGSSPLIGWGRLERVSDVLRAIGLSSVAQLVLSAEVLDGMTEEHSVPGCEAEAMRRHAELSGLIAAELAAPEDRTVARTAGLLHSVGTLVVTTGARDRLEAAIADARARSVALAETEEDHLGVTLPEVGARLLTLWGLPLDVCSTVRDYRLASVPLSATMPPAAAVRVASWAAGLALVCDGGLDPVIAEPMPESASPTEAEWWQPLIHVFESIGVDPVFLEGVLV